MQLEIKAPAAPRENSLLPSGRPYLCREWLIADARDVVLAALDDFARRSGLPGLPAGEEGCTDADMPDVFRGIDAQVDRLIARSGVGLLPKPMTDEQIVDAALRLACANAAGGHMRVVVISDEQAGARAP